MAVKKEHVFLSLFCLVLVLAVGCASMGKKDDPKWDKVLVYDRPYDFTYLRTLEALNSFPDWLLETTDKEKGYIIIRNTEYAHLYDRDKTVVRVNIKRLEQRKTSVSFDPTTQQFEKGGVILDRIDSMMKQISKGDDASLSTAAAK